MRERLEALCVYTPHRRDGFQVSQELCRFPRHSWIYATEVRRSDVYALTNTMPPPLSNAVVQRQGLKTKRPTWRILEDVRQYTHELTWMTGQLHSKAR